MTAAEYITLRKLYKGYSRKFDGQATIKEVVEASQTPSFIQQTLDEQNFPKGPYYRGMSLDSLPEVGQEFSFEYSAWVLSRKVASFYTQPPIKVCFCMDETQNHFISFNNLTTKIKDILKSPLDGISKIERAILDEVAGNKYLIITHNGPNDELIMAPETRTIKNITQDGEVYYIEV